MIAAFAIQPQAVAQFSEVLTFMINKLRPPNPPLFPLAAPLTFYTESDAQAPTNLYRKTLLRMIRNILHTKRIYEGRGDSSVVVPVVLSCLMLGCCNDPAIRIEVICFMTEIIWPPKDSYI